MKTKQNKTNPHKMDNLLALSHFATMRQSKLNHIIKSFKSCSNTKIETVLAAHALISLNAKAKKKYKR